MHVVHGRRRLWWSNRFTRPTRTWLRNRWNWRKKRRVRREIAGLKRLAVPIDQLDAPMSPDVRRIATLLDQWGVSTVLHLGYGLGEALVTSARAAPDRIEPLTAELAAFDDDEVMGIGEPSERLVRAVTARNRLLEAVRDVVSERPKHAPPQQ